MRSGKFGPLFDPEEDDSGGGGGAGGGGSDTGGDDPNPLSEFLDGEGNLVVTVDGQEKTMGPAELKAELQKGLSGNARLREAAKAEDRVQYATDVEDALGDDVDAYFRVAEARGVSEDDAAEILEYYESGGDETSQEDEVTEAETGRSAGTKAAGSPEVRYVNRPVSQEDQRTMRWAEDKQKAEVRDWIHQDLNEGLDSDPRFVTIMKTGGRRAEQMRTIAQNAVKRIVVSERIAYTPEVRGRVLDELNHSLEVFGVASNAEGGSLPPGAGHAPLGTAPELTQATRVHQRPDIDSPEYENYCTGKLIDLQTEAFYSDK